MTEETMAEPASSPTPEAPKREGLHPGMTFAEILAPMREDFQATGMTDEELGDFVDEVVARVRAQRREGARSTGLDHADHKESDR